ncbi:MAG: hypothetical protein SXA11_08075 [Cyanobacteriota bacterium]|nr:hypothetical protein [Cyanobacteriota bacterium]
MNEPLSEYFGLNRRYYRSLNLERDLDKLEALNGYILTARSLDALNRILTGFTDGKSNRAWTLTSVYGTGKSAFAQFLCCLCGPTSHPLREQSLKIVESALGKGSSEYYLLQKHIPQSGWFRAVATAKREPIANTIVRALARGAEVFWEDNAEKPAIASGLAKLEIEIAGGKILKSNEIPYLVRLVSRTAQTGIFIIIDELGKNLEFAAYNQATEDLYLLQELAELPVSSNYPIYLLGMLHQSFSEYGQRLAAVQRNEWAKIQGRFEDIPFIDSTIEMMKLIAEVIDSSRAKKLQAEIKIQAGLWLGKLTNLVASEELSVEAIASVYPLHPIAALVLPSLCTRYGQDRRSLFTFLTSSEPFSFKNFLDETTLKSADKTAGVTLKLDRIYDYFMEANALGFGRSDRLQRWLEIQTLIDDAKHLDLDSIKVLKTIGILNLVTTTGELRATRDLVKLAMCDLPSEKQELNRWQKVISKLLKRRVITHFKVLDELRLWEGSEFNVDAEVARRIEEEREPITNLLAQMYPLKPLVVQRHSYQTGTLRYFERRYLDGSSSLTNLGCQDNEADGLICYWLEEEAPKKVPEKTADFKPLVLLVGSKLDVLKMRVLEFVALQQIQTSAPQLQSDGVARKEVAYRFNLARRLLDESLHQCFDVSGEDNFCFIGGKKKKIERVKEFNEGLSQLCDRVYDKGLIIWNELINRRVLTNQGSRARKELIEAMLKSADKEKLGLGGYGPATSMYYSVFKLTEIHRKVEGKWGFLPPPINSGVRKVWEAMEEFCLEATAELKSFDLLYLQLQLPPYGVKGGLIPVLLAAVLLYRRDDVGVYKDGSFIPVLGAEHFELLVKEPSRFAAKHFEVLGMRSQVFTELEAILGKRRQDSEGKVRNATLLTAVKPLFKLVKKLPAYTKKSKSLSQEAAAVLRVLQKAREPDELLFASLPEACGFGAIGGSREADDGSTAAMYKEKLVRSLHEIQTAYDRLLNRCQELLMAAFGVRDGEAKLRQDLQLRARKLECVEPVLKRFLLAAVEETKADKEWLEALVMVVADKPPKSWNDEDATGFEVKLGDIARRFENLEALQGEVASSEGVGVAARRITVARPDGRETHRMVWVDAKLEGEVEELVAEILNKPGVRDNARLQQALVARLTEEVLGDG